MKEGLNHVAIERIASAFLQLKPGFDAEQFTGACLVGLDQLELKARVYHIIAQLKTYLGGDLRDTSAYLLKLPKIWDRGDEDDALSGFAAWPVIDYVAEVGIAEPELGMRCLRQLTSLFSAEFAIRSFIDTYPEICLKIFEDWIQDDSEHVRRLVSEGTRPRLPWGKQLKRYIDDPTPIIPLLDALKADPSLYVRRSVANNLNDIAKDHPEKVVEICLQWQQQMASATKQGQTHVGWVIKHAARTLIKQGHPASFSLLGFTAKPKVALKSFALGASSVAIGETISFDCTLGSTSNKQRFVVDFAVHYLRSNGRLSPKVFKLKDCALNTGEEISLTKSISFKPISTRRYYPGKHILAIHVNGKPLGSLKFELLP